MARTPRKDILAAEEVGLFHCTQRCVRRAWLCGEDPYSGKNYDHRKVLIRERLEELASIMAIDVCSYSVMVNHIHVILRNRPDIVKTWSDEEVARRWWRLFPKRRNKDRSPAEPDQHELGMLLADKKALQERRERLSSISWFMRCLAEVIARKANVEDQTTGRFWQGRFKCQPLLDDAAILACSAYVDLNAVRASVCQTPEESEFTSACDRIHSRLARQGKKPKKRYRFAITPRDNWLAPLELKGEAGPDVCATGKRASNKGFLTMKLEDYLNLLDWTGRQVAQGKRGKIPAEFAPLLERVGLSGDLWVDMVVDFKKWFRSVAGMPSTLRQEADRRGQTRFNLGAAFPSSL